MSETHIQADIMAKQIISIRFPMGVDPKVSAFVVATVRDELVKAIEAVAKQYAVGADTEQYEFRVDDLGTRVTMFVIADDEEAMKDVDPEYLKAISKAYEETEASMPSDEVAS